MQIDKVTHIRLVFENVEVATIPIECVETISIDNIKQKIIKHCNGVLREYEVCEQMSLVLNSKANVSFPAYTEMTVFERIQKYNDIVSIMFCINDKVQQEVYAPWKPARMEQNLLQRSTIIDDKLEIMIGDIDNEKQSD